MVDQTKILLILRAAGELLDESGFDELNTTEIARRAGVSTATLYRSFPDKYAILRGVVFHLQTQRNLALQELLQRFTSEPDWRAVIRSMVYRMYELRLSEPGGRSSRRMLGYSAELMAFGRENTLRVAKLAAQAMCRRNPQLSRATAERISVTSVAALTSILDLACDEPRHGKRYATEAAEVCIAYLSAHLDA